MNKEEPLVSIIVPVYNVEPYIDECLDSLVNQTYKNIEIILVDDGSTDNSGKICDDYRDRYSNIKVIHKQNQGLGMARNTGLDCVSGEFVYFFDSDDYVETDEIEYLLNKIIENDVDVCLTGYKSVNDQKEILVTRKYNDAVYRGIEVKESLFPKMLGSLPDGSDRIEMSAGAQMYAIKPIKEYNIRFVSERELISEDLVFNMMYMQYARGVCTVKRIGNYYRNNQSSLSHQYRKNRMEQTLYFYEYIANELKTLGYGNEAIERHTKQFFIGIRSCIAQEKKNTDDSRKEKISRIKKLCENKLVCDAINIYPVKELGIKQQIFLYLIKTKMAGLLYLIA